MGLGSCVAPRASDADGNLVSVLVSIVSEVRRPHWALHLSTRWPLHPPRHRKAPGSSGTPRPVRGQRFWPFYSRTARRVVAWWTPQMGGRTGRLKRQPSGCVGCGSPATNAFDAELQKGFLTLVEEERLRHRSSFQTQSQAPQATDCRFGGSSRSDRFQVVASRGRQTLGHPRDRLLKLLKRRKSG